MAKLVNEQKRGSVGPSTFQSSPHGTIERSRAQPLNPRTERQQAHRNLVASIASNWRSLTEPQRAGWTALADQLRGNLKGHHLFVKANVQLVEGGLPLLEVAPPVPVFGSLACAGLRVADTPRVQLLQLAVTGGADKLLIDACAPVGAGIQHVENLFRRVTVVEAPATGPADLDLTASYVERFSKPPAGWRVVVRITAMTNGFRGPSLRVGTLVAGLGG